MQTQINTSESNLNLDGALGGILGSLSIVAVQKLDRIVRLNRLDQPEELYQSTKALRTVSSAQLMEVSFCDPRLKAYQKEAVAKVLKLSRDHIGSIIAFAPGLGKTMAAGEVLAQTQITDSQGKPILISVPNSLITQWKESLIDQGVKIRQAYYLELIKSYASFTAVQRQKVENSLLQFYFSHQQQLNECEIRSKQLQEKLQSKLNVHKTIEADKKKRSANHIIKLKDQINGLAHKKIILQARLVEAKKIIEIGLKTPVFGVQLLARLGENPLIKMSIIESGEIQQWVDIFCKTHLSHLSFGKEKAQTFSCLLRSRQFLETQKRLNQFEENSQLEDLLISLIQETTKDPMPLDEARKFLDELTQQKDKPPSLETSPIRQALLTNVYQQIKVYLSKTEMKTVSEEDGLHEVEQLFNSQDSTHTWKIIVTTPSTLANLSTEKLRQLKQIPWKRVIIDEAHEISWSRQNKEKISSKIIRDFIKDIHQDHHTFIMLLTGTPFVNHVDDLFSLLQLANPQASVEDLGTLLDKRYDEVLVALGKVEEDSRSNNNNTSSSFDDNQMALEMALKKWLLALEHARSMCQYLLDIRSPEEDLVRANWTTPEGKCMLPQKEVQLIELNLTKEQQEIYDKNIGRNLIARDPILLSNFVHPYSLEDEHINNTNINEEKRQLRKNLREMKDEELKAFMKQSSLFTYLFGSILEPNTQTVLSNALEKGEKVLFFIPYILPSVVLKFVLGKYFRRVRTRLYNGQKNPSCKMPLLKNLNQKKTSQKINRLLKPSS